MCQDSIMLLSSHFLHWCSPAWLGKVFFSPKAVSRHQPSSLALNPLLWFWLLLIHTWSFPSSALSCWSTATVAVYPFITSVFILTESWVGQLAWTQVMQEGNGWCMEQSGWRWLLFFSLSAAHRWVESYFHLAKPKVIRKYPWPIVSLAWNPMD